MQKKRIKIIPDRIFHKLWTEAEKYVDYEDYVSACISNSKLFNYKAHGLDYPEYAGMLKNIHKLRNYKLRDISETASKKKSELSHIFCIPIRTIEAWYSQINEMPSYILLMMLKHFHMFELGKYIRLESEIEYIETKPAIYAKRKDKEIPEAEDKQQKKQKSDFEKFMESEDYDEYLDRLIAKAKSRRQ